LFEVGIEATFFDSGCALFPAQAHNLTFTSKERKRELCNVNSITFTRLARENCNEELREESAKKIV
jgi:hypothetical protein